VGSLWSGILKGACDVPENFLPVLPFTHNNLPFTHNETKRAACGAAHTYTEGRRVMGLRAPWLTSRANLTSSLGASRTLAPNPRRGPPVPAN
jgi:hypothetical protein